jgi:membrane-associated phospholipid phosphatase
MFLYKHLNIDTLPFIGYGKRPDGATNCGSYLVYPDKISISYGMPSGHSELSWFFATYIILDLIYNTDNTKTIKIIPYYILFINSGLLLAYAFTNSYARVVIEKCHTKGQVIVGGIIGIIKGIILYYIYRIYIR